MKKINYLFISILLLTASVVSAQYGIGTDEPKATLDITSTKNGILIPRMTSTQRDAITTPANGLLIFNTINNSFEVFKTSCSCWVSIYDGGNTPASNLVNTAPTAENIFLSGQYMVGKTITLNYTYTDGQTDPEGLTTIQWQISSQSNGSNPTNISGATSSTYIPISANSGNYIRAIVNPRASTGVLNGVATATQWILIEAATVPTANNLTVSGTPAQGSTLTANYIFAGGSGIENVSSTGSEYIWQTASDNLGSNLQNAPLYNQTQYSTNYIPQSNLLGRYIRISVKVKDNNGLQANNYVNSTWVGPIATATETAPAANAVSYSPAPAVNLSLTGSYSYYDVNNDPEGASLFQWYLADNSSGLNQTPIASATNSTLIVPISAGNKFVGFSVTPKALSGTLTGNTSNVYYNSNVTAPIATFTFTGSAHKQLPFFSANKIMNTQENAIEVEVNVTSAGGLTVSSTTVNGYSFSGNFALTTGTQWITLIPTGTQTAYNSSGDSFTITGIGATTETKTFIIINTKKGANYTTHYNGWVGNSNATPNAVTYTVGETFNNNTGCVNALISTSACPAGNTVTGASGSVYPTVSINGQCWMKTNLKEIPSNFTSNTPTTYTPSQDYGGWGYYNISTTNGSAGYATTQQITDYGMLYQWKAAMNNATYERAQGACPTGWHVPSDCEWKYLEHGIGLSLNNTNTQYWSRNDNNLSYKLRSEGVNSTNSTGFSALLAGYRSSDVAGSFISSSIDVFMAVSTKFGSTAMARRSTVAAGGAVSSAWARETDSYVDKIAISVRCIKD